MQHIRSWTRYLPLTASIYVLSYSLPRLLKSASHHCSKPEPWETSLRPPSSCTAATVSSGPPQNASWYPQVHSFLLDYRNGLPQGSDRLQLLPTPPEFPVTEEKHAPRHFRFYSKTLVTSLLKPLNDHRSPTSQNPNSLAGHGKLVTGPEPPAFSSSSTLPLTRPYLSRWAVHKSSNTAGWFLGAFSMLVTLTRTPFPMPICPCPFAVTPASKLSHFERHFISTPTVIQLTLFQSLRSYRT